MYLKKKNDVTKTFPIRVFEKKNEITKTFSLPVFEKKGGITKTFSLPLHFTQGPHIWMKPQYLMMKSNNVWDDLN